MGIIPETAKEGADKAAMADQIAKTIKNLYKSDDPRDKQTALENIEAQRRNWENGSGTAGRVLAILQAEDVIENLT